MVKHLEQINSPEDIKKLNYKELKTLSAEIRTYLLDVISKNGGHLASNLGVVELTLAIHKVFDTSKDRLIWDVGHQSYIHKIITGRREAFTTLRQKDGLSGFPKREESTHDAFNTGHSSTSIAAALGFAKARDLKKQSHKIIAVIGDGSMTGGEAYEALNLTSALNTDLLVVLNDNRMSIAPNIGGMSEYLNRLRASAIYNKSKKGVRYFLGKVPKVGNTLVKCVERFKENLKYIMIPGVVFTELGFNYYGPIDGHDIKGLVEILNKLKDIKGPILLHVMTRKGKGYLPAQQDAANFHGVGPFEVESGNSIAGPSNIPSYTKVFSDTMLAMAKQDNRVLGITAAMADGTGLDKFANVYPQRFFDVGIAEQTAVTLGSALALDGFRPVIAIYSSFLQRAYDQIITDAALHKAPVIFAIDRAGLVGEDGPTHHGVFDISYLRPIPNLAILVPRDEKCLRDMLWSALQHEAGPIAIRYPRGKAQGVSLAKSAELMTWGKGEILKLGQDAVILSIGPITYTAIRVAEELAKIGYNIGVVDARFVNPLDEELILSLAEQYPTIVTLEENNLAGGFGTAILELLAAKEKYNIKIHNIGIPNNFVSQGNQKVLLADLNLDVKGLTKQLLEILQRNNENHE